MTPATLLTYDDTTQPVSEWALDYGVLPAVIIARLERGLSMEATITTPMVTAKGQQLRDKHLDRYIMSLPKRRQKRKASRSEGHRAPPASAPRYTFNGEALTLMEWERRTGINRQTLRHRFKKGWPIERALTEPATQGRRPSRATADEATA